MFIEKSKLIELYKNLYRYGLQLKYTDKQYYFQYIRKQFKPVEGENTTVLSSEKIERLFKVINKILEVSV